MPRAFELAPHVARLRGDVFSSVAARLPSDGRETWPFPGGDVWYDPPPGCRGEDLRAEDHERLYRYGAVGGLPALRDALAARSARKTGVATAAEDVLVAGGATAALAGCVGALVSPGEQVALLAPYWPLIEGTVRCFGAEPVPVPFHGHVAGPDEAASVLSRHVGERTAALYVCSPNNPSGLVVPAPWLEALVEVARARDLWILSDEVYEDFVYGGEHVSLRSLAPERVLCVGSFSKAFAMAGARCGWVVAPPPAAPGIRAVMRDLAWGTSVASQHAALHALVGPGDAWLEDKRRQFADLGHRAAARLGVPAPEGGTFLFLDVEDRLGTGGLLSFLGDCAEQGLLLAPGTSFGPYPTRVRVCFTAAPPAATARGIDLLARILRGGR